MEAIVVVNNSYSQITSDLPRDVIEALDRKCSFFVQGYQFSELYKKNIWDGKKHLFSVKTFAFQTGLISLIKQVFSDFQIEMIFRDLRVKPLKKYDIEFNGFELRDYQKAAVAEAVRIGRGVLNTPTGSGKTIIMSKLVHEIGVKTLVLVNTKEALYDTYRTLKRCFDNDYVTCFNDNKSINKFITITTMPMAIKELNSKRDDSLVNEKFDCLILDESHHSAAKSWQGVIFKISPYHVFGFTGTNFRGDGADLLLLGVSGRAIYKIGTVELQKMGFLSLVDIYFVDILFPEIKANYSDYFELYRIGIITNEYRNGIIQQIVKRHIGKSILVVVEKIEHGEIILELLKEVDENTVFVQGKTKNRNEIKLDFETGKIRTLVASRLYNESADLPILNVVINCSGGKSGIAVIQRIGRSLRIHQSKERAIVYDFNDVFSSKLEKHSHERMKVIKKEGHKIIELAPDDI